MTTGTPMDWSVSASMNPSSDLPLRPRVALVACGRVGTAVAVLLQRAGCDVTGLWSRSAPSLERAAALLDAPRLDLAAPISADLVIVGANDPAIADVARMIAPSVPPGIVVAHLSGSLGAEVLSPVEDSGAIPAALHPVQACPDVPTAIERLPGSAWGVTTSDQVFEPVAGWVRDLLKGSPVRVQERDRAIWHAASVMTSNGIAALMAFGESLLSGIGMNQAEKILGPLAAGTVANAVGGGGGGTTLTGPVVRGEVETIERHLTSLESKAPHLLAGYRTVVTTILAAAREHGRIDEDTAARIEGLLR